MIAIEQLRVRLGEIEALAVDQMQIDRSERIGVCGPNGSGKSTLLRVLAGLIEPTAGAVRGLPPPGRAVLVHQQPYLFRGSARDNVAYALALAGRPDSAAIEWLERCGARALAERSVKELSGGERRRVAIARALSVQPELLLLDEPFVGLDEAGLSAAHEALADYDGTLVLAAPDLDSDLVVRCVEVKPVGAPSREKP